MRRGAAVRESLGESVWDDIGRGRRPSALTIPWLRFGPDWLARQSGCAAYAALRRESRAGRLLLYAEVVEEYLAERRNKGNWRVDNLEEWGKRSRRDEDGRRLCAVERCHALVTGRHRCCPTHRVTAEERRRERRMRRLDAEARNAAA